MRQLELENDILRAAAKVLKAESPSPMTNREKALVINELRATTGRSLKELTGSLRISKSSYEYQRRAISRPDKYAGLRTRVREVFDGASASRGYRYVTHALRAGDDPVAVSEKVVRRITGQAPLSPSEASHNHPSPEPGRTDPGSPWCDNASHGYASRTRRRTPGAPGADR